MKTRIKKIDSVKFYYIDPRVILDDVNSIPELYYLANLTIATNYKNRINPEIPLLIGYDAYSKLINYYGGTTLAIPTKEELQSNLLGVMSYYYYNIKGLSWNDVVKKLGMTPTKGSRRLLRNRWKAFKDIVDRAEDKIPEIPIPNPTTDTLMETSESPILCGDTYIPKELFLKVAKTLIDDLNENKILSEDDIQKMLDRYE